MQARKLSSATGSPSTNAMFGIETPMGRTPLQLQGASLGVTSPRAKAPDFAKATSRLAFWRHLPQHEGRHSFSDGGLGYSVRPLRGHRQMSKLQAGAEAPAYSRSASPRRRRFDSPPSDPASRVTLVPVLKSLNTHERLPSSYSLNIGG